MPFMPLSGTHSKKQKNKMLTVSFYGENTAFVFFPLSLLGSVPAMRPPSPITSRGRSPLPSPSLTPSPHPRLNSPLGSFP